MNGFVCCACEYRFPEAAALQTQVTGGFIEFCCPYCGSDDIEDAENLEAIQAAKREAQANRDEAAYDRQQQSLMDGDHLECKVKQDQELRDAGRGHLVRS